MLNKNDISCSLLIKIFIIYMFLLLISIFFFVRIKQKILIFSIVDIWRKIFRSSSREKREEKLNYRDGIMWWPRYTVGNIFFFMSCRQYRGLWQFEAHFLNEYFWINSPWICWLCGQALWKFSLDLIGIRIR